MADEKVRIILEAKNNASSGIKQVNSDLASLQGSVAGLVKGAGLAALAFGIVDVGKSLFAMSQEAQYAVATQNQLDAVLRSTGGVAGVTAAQVNDLASKIQELTNFGDEEARSAQSLLLTFTKIGSDVFPRATMAAVDMSAAFGQDLKSSVIQLGKALNDPIEGISALSRIGVQFSDSQKQMIEAMMEVNDIAGAQAIILKEVETQVKGSAEAQVNAVIQLGNAWADLREAIGLVVLPTVENQAKELTEDVNVLRQAIEKLSGIETELDLKERLLELDLIIDASLKSIEELSKPANIFQNLFRGPELDRARSRLEEAVAEFNEISSKLGEPIIDVSRLSEGIATFTQISVDAKVALLQMGDSTDSTVVAIAHLANIAAQAAPNLAALRGQILDLVEAERAIISIADQARGALESSFKGKISELGVAGAISGFDAANKEVEQMLVLLEEQGASLEEKDFAVAGIVDRWRDVNSQLGKTSTAVSQIDKAFEDLKSKVSSVLSGALTVDVGINADDLLPRQDAINEDARRLADVAVNGFASPWADYLNNKFPGMFGEAFEGGDIKTKAAQLLKDFEDGLRPELIDKDKAKERVKRMLLGEASMAELAAQVTAELQAELGGATPADLAAKVQQALGGGTGGAETGADFAATTLNAVITSDVGGNMVAIVVNQAAGKSALVKASGESHGKLWGTGVLTGAQSVGVPEGLLLLLVGFLWPKILAKMAEQRSKTGTMEAQ